MSSADGAWVYIAALAASFVVATVASPAGASEAVLLLPFQVGWRSSKSGRREIP